MFLQVAMSILLIQMVWSIFLSGVQEDMPPVICMARTITPSKFGGGGRDEGGGGGGGLGGGGWVGVGAWGGSGGTKRSRLIACILICKHMTSYTSIIT